MPLGVDSQLGPPSVAIIVLVPPALIRTKCGPLNIGSSVFVPVVKPTVSSSSSSFTVNVATGSPACVLNCSADPAVIVNVVKSSVGVVIGKHFAVTVTVAVSQFVGLLFSQIV